MPVSMESNFGKNLRFIFLMTDLDFIIKGQDFHDDRSKFYYAWTRFIINSRDIHDCRSRFYYERLRFHDSRSIFSWRLVEIFMMTGSDFIMNGWDFHNDRLEILLSMVEILMATGRDFIMNSRDFYDDGLRFYYKWSRFWWEKIKTFYDQSRFSNWHVEILLWKVEVFMMIGWNFIMSTWDVLDNNLRFYLFTPGVTQEIQDTGQCKISPFCFYVWS